MPVVLFLLFSLVKRSFGTMHIAMRYRLGKKHRLRSSLAIARLFDEGKGFFKFPLKVRYLVLDTETEPGLSCAFVVPKRSFKKAVDRNQIKRHMREAFRLNKHVILDEMRSGEKIEMIWIYADRRILPSRVFVKAALQIFNRLVKEKSQ